MSSPPSIPKHDGTSKDASVRADLGDDGLPKDGLTDSQKESLFKWSRISFEFQSVDDWGLPSTNKRGLPYLNNPNRVVADTDLSPNQLDFAYIDGGKPDIVVTRSSRASEYLKLGWVDAGLAAKTPWGDVGVNASMSQSSAESHNQNHVYITARYNCAHRIIKIKRKPFKLDPHPDFENAVMNALAITDEKKRTQEVQNVLGLWGTMFITSVEVGGVKHLTIERTLNETKDVIAKINAALSTTFGPSAVDAKGGSGTKNTQSDKQENEFAFSKFDTMGGAAEAQNFAKWRESFYDLREIEATRVLGVASSISLFDCETQLKIKLAVRRAPLYIFRNQAGRHCLSINEDTSKLTINSDGLWEPGRNIATVLTAPLDGAVALYHMYDGKRHTYTYDLDEKSRLISQFSFHDAGILCYVYLTQKEGTLLLGRTAGGAPDNGFEISAKPLSNVSGSGYTAEDYFRCYVYPA